MTNTQKLTSGDLQVVGRPSSYSDAVADYICEEISAGRSLVSICAEAGMPRPSTVFRWLADPRFGTFREMYARAREAQADALFDEILAIADTPAMGLVETVRPDGTVEVRREDMLGHRRLQVDVRKWAAAKLAPRKYGDRIKLEHLPAPRHQEINREEALNILTSRLTDLMERRARKGVGG